MLLRFAALLCGTLSALTLPALTAADMWKCNGFREYVRPGSTHLLDSKGTRFSEAGWTGFRCFSAETDPGYQLILDCSAPGRYFETNPKCHIVNNYFDFMPYNNGKKFWGCGTLNTLKLRSDTNYFHAMFANNKGYNDNYKGIKCDVTAEKSTRTTTTTTTTVMPKCSCGKHNKDRSRIVNGQETKPNEYPFFAGLVRKGTTLIFCGGSLISYKWVLSASHCVTTAAQIQVVLGGHNMDKPESSRQFIDVASIIKHENSFWNDIALLKLARSVTFNSQISPVCLPPKQFTDALYKTNATVMGYGHTSHGGTGTRVLQDVQVKLMSYTDCKNFGGSYQSRVTHNDICSYGYDNDACQGDSGGPLVYDKNDRLTLIGVVSWGVRCASVGRPGVFVKVENYLDWIHEKTSNGICHE